MQGVFFVNYLWIVCSYGDVTIAGDVLEKLGLCWARMGFVQIETSPLPHLQCHGASIFAVGHLYDKDGELRTCSVGMLNVKILRRQWKATGEIWPRSWLEYSDEVRCAKSTRQIYKGLSTLKSSDFLINFYEKYLSTRVDFLLRRHSVNLAEKWITFIEYNSTLHRNHTIGCHLVRFSIRYLRIRNHFENSYRRS